MNDFQVPGDDKGQLLCCTMAVLTPAQKSRSARFQPMKALLKHECVGSQSPPDRGEDYLPPTSSSFASGS